MEQSLQIWNGKESAVRKEEAVWDVVSILTPEAAPNGDAPDQMTRGANSAECFVADRPLPIADYLFVSVNAAR